MGMLLLGPAYLDHRLLSRVLDPASEGGGVGFSGAARRWLNLEADATDSGPSEGLEADHRDDVRLVEMVDGQGGSMAFPIFPLHISPMKSWIVSVLEADPREALGNDLPDWIVAQEVEEPRGEVIR